MSKNKKLENSKNIVNKKDENTKASNDNEMPNDTDFNQMMDDAPAPVRKMMREFTMFMSGGQLSQSNKFLESVGEKLTDKHITSIIENSDRGDKRWFIHSTVFNSLKYLLALIGIGVFIFLTLFLAKDSKDLYFEILKIIVLFGGGFGLGFGVKKLKSK